ncbi:hypothetical protein T439DRAFT_356729 [Meredithblackwellia eburnea MCA 4105]
MGLFGKSAKPTPEKPQRRVTGVTPRPRAVLLGQHPSKVAAVVKLLEGNDTIQLVAAVSDMMDAQVVLKAQVPPVDIFVCGAYFELEAAQDIVASVGGDLKLIKVPDGLMMEGGGPLAVIAYIVGEVKKLQC